MLAQLQGDGWTDERAIPSIQPRAVNSMDALTDPAFRAAMLGAAFNQVPYLPELRRIVRCVLGSGAFSYPAKVLRAVYPERPQARPRGRYIHYDYGVSGVQDMLTSWIPLMDIPPVLGGLAVQPGGHLGPPRRPRPLSRSEPGWASTSYEPGDVIIFHCLTPHAALPNQGWALRISGTSAGSGRISRLRPSSSSGPGATRRPGPGRLVRCLAGCSGARRGGSRFRPG